MNKPNFNIRLKLIHVFRKLNFVHNIIHMETENGRIKIKHKLFLLQLICQIHIYICHLKFVFNFILSSEGSLYSVF